MISYSRKEQTIASFTVLSSLHREILSLVSSLLQTEPRRHGGRTSCGQSYEILYAAALGGHWEYWDEQHSASWARGSEQSKRITRIVYVLLKRGAGDCCHLANHKVSHNESHQPGEQAYSWCDCCALALCIEAVHLTSFGRQTNHQCVTIVNIHHIAFTRAPAVLTANFYCYHEHHHGVHGLYWPYTDNSTVQSM